MVLKVLALRQKYNIVRSISDARTMPLSKGENRMNEISTQGSPALLTISEAATQLRISNWLLYHLIRTNQLQTITIGSRRFVLHDDLVKYVNERKAVKV